MIVNGAAFWVGEYALAQRATVIGLSDDWVATDNHAALLLMASKWLKQKEGIDLGDGQTQVVMGLPSKSYAEQKKLLANEVVRYLPNAKVKIIPQPNAPFFQHMFLDSGRPNPERDLATEAWAVVDVGFHTTDMTMMNPGGQFVVDSFDSTVGVSAAAEHLLRALQSSMGLHRLQMDEMDLILRTGKLKYNGEVIQVENLVREARGLVTKAIIDKTQQLFGANAHRLDGILLAGGGASLVQNELKAVWKHTQLINNPRLSIAIGYCRHGSMLNYRSTLLQQSGLRAA